MTDKECIEYFKRQETLGKTANQICKDIAQKMTKRGKPTDWLEVKRWYLGAHLREMTANEK